MSSDASTGSRSIGYFSSEEPAALTERQRQVARAVAWMQDHATDFTLEAAIRELYAFESESPVFNRVIGDLGASICTPLKVRVSRWTLSN